MKPIRDFIVHVPLQYKDKIECKSGLVLELDSNIMQVKDTIRHGKVEAIPEDCDYDVKVGDELYFHHGIVGQTTMDEGFENLDSHYLYEKKKGLFRVPIDKRWPMAFAIERDGEFRCLDGICFVRQDSTKKYDTETIIIPDNKKDVIGKGTMVYDCHELNNRGVKVGDTVLFERDSEYTFEVKGETLYRMFSKWIMAKVDEDKQ